MMEIPEELREQLKGWKTGLLVSATHQPKPLFTNALHALRGAPEWEGVLAYDDFALTVMAVQRPPGAAATTTGPVATGPTETTP